MYYIQYLSSLCQRRHWADPLYESYRTTTGFCCTVRVNHREYQTDTEYESDYLSRENAAMRAYMICRNFSVNDGMYPTGHKGGVVQGLPVAIGTGRHSSYNSDGYSAGSNSGGSSPRSIEVEPRRKSGRSSRSSASARALVYGYGHSR